MTRDPNFEEQYFGIAVRKGNTKLLAQINDGLRKVYKNGTYAKVYQHSGSANTRRSRAPDYRNPPGFPPRFPRHFRRSRGFSLSGNLRASLIPSGSRTD